MPKTTVEITEVENTVTVDNPTYVQITETENRVEITDAENAVAVQETIETIVPGPTQIVVAQVETVETIEADGLPVHGSPLHNLGTPVDIGLANATGSGLLTVRDDHVHAHPAFATGKLHTEYGPTADPNVWLGLQTFNAGIDLGIGQAVSFVGVGAISRPSVGVLDIGHTVVRLRSSSLQLESVLITAINAAGGVVGVPFSLYDPGDNTQGGGVLDINGVERLVAHSVSPHLRMTGTAHLVGSLGINIAAPARTLDVRGEVFVFGQITNVETFAIRSASGQTARTFLVENHAGADYFAVFSPSLPITDITTSILTTLATMTFGANNINYKIFDVGQNVNVDTYTGHAIFGMNFLLTLAGSTGTVSTIENIRVGITFAGIAVTTSAAYLAAQAPSSAPAAGSGTFNGISLPDMGHANWENVYPIHILDQTLAGTLTCPIRQEGLTTTTGANRQHNRLAAQTLIGADATPEVGYALELRNDFLLGAFFQELREMTAPSAPAANGGRVYAEDNGAGKTRLMVLFATGAAQQVAIEP